MKRALIISTTAALGLAMLATTATAHDDQKGGKRGGPRGPQIEFSEIDTDSDGKITQAEMDAHRQARFDAMDTNSDGSLSTEELLAAREGAKEKRMARMIQRMDANNDGVLTVDEMGPKGDKGDMFAKLDTDGDGAISEEEMNSRKGHRMGKGGRFGKSSDK